mgnify:CR=1 FL=1
MRVLGRMVYYYCAARNLKKSAFEEPEERDEKKAEKTRATRGEEKEEEEKPFSKWSRHKKTVVYPVLRRRNRGNATLISWSLFLRVLQGRATICQPPRPGGTLGFIIIIILSRFLRGALFAPFSF